MASLNQDVRQALRFLGRRPAFAGTVILTLALAIGATTAVFSVVNALLLRPLAIENQSHVAILWERIPARGVDKFPLSYPEFRYWRERARGFAQLSAMTFNSSYPLAWAVGDSTDQELVMTAQVTHDFFGTLGGAPSLGRPLLPEDDLPRAPAVAVLSHGFWRRRFGGDVSVVGRVVYHDGVRYTVVGVMPPHFDYPPRTDIWASFVSGLADPDDPRKVFLYALGRVEPTHSLDQARLDLERVVAEYSSALSSSPQPAHVVMTPIAETIVGDARRPLVTALIAVGVVLAIATANAASLLLMRGMRLRQELALRMALGADRWDVTRYFVAHTMLMSLLAGGIGIWLARRVIELLPVLAPKSLPRVGEVTVDTTVLLVALGVSLLTALFSGFVPALLVSRAAVHEGLKEDEHRAPTGRRSRRLIRAVVTAEIALTSVLLSGAAVLGRTFVNEQRLDLGFNPKGLIFVAVPISDRKYPEPQNRYAFFDELVSRVKRLPGVVGATAVPAEPLQGGTGFSVTFLREGQDDEEARTNPWLSFVPVQPGYFETLGIQTLQGRTFTATDDAHGPLVVVINEALARRFRPSGGAVGGRLRLRMGAEPPWREVVGVVANTRYRDLHQEQLIVYVPMRQSGPWPSHLAVRAEPDPSPLLGTVRAEIKGLDPTVPLAEAVTMQQILHDALARPRFTLLLFALLAGLAAVLALVGTYAVTAFSVEQRTREIGLRMALGADATSVKIWILREGLVMIGAGLGLGLLVSLLLGRVIQGLLFGVSPMDPTTLATVALALGLIATLAVYVPGRQALRVDPIVTLRDRITPAVGLPRRPHVPSSAGQRPS